MLIQSIKGGRQMSKDRDRTVFRRDDGQWVNKRNDAVIHAFSSFPCLKLIHFHTVWNHRPDDLENNIKPNPH